MEIIENLFQIVATGGCGLYALLKNLSTHKREWLLLALFSGAFFFGDLYWSLYIYFYGDTPAISYVSDSSWYASYLFLILLIQYTGSEALRKETNKLPWLGPIFTACMCIFFMTHGEYVSNIITAALMGTILYYSIRGIIYYKDSNSNGKCIFIMACVFCAIEYLLWIMSILWIGGNTALNPYYWCDIMLSLCFIAFIPAVRKVVSE